MAAEVLTSFYFLPKDPLWEKEKPYTLKFQPAEKFPGTNGARVEVDNILVEDIRGRESSFSIEKNGFAVMPLKNIGMKYEDFHDDQKVESVYLRNLAAELKVFLGASRVQIFDFVVSPKLVQSYYVAVEQRRSGRATPNFLLQLASATLTSSLRTFSTSVCIVERILYLCLAEEDAMPIEARTQIQILNPEQAGQLLSRRHQYVKYALVANPTILQSHLMRYSVWKPLVGPVENWPLAVCDKSSIDLERDIVCHDSVFPESLVETGELQFNKSQKFYYLSKQKEDEALVLLQTDSESGSGRSTNSASKHCR